jgi:hypothetical protein
MYTIWYLDCWDEAIEENNAAGSCLTKEFAQQQEDSSTSHFDRVWISGKSEVTMGYILEHLWCREEVDGFVLLNPETSIHIFKIHKPYTPDDRDWLRGYLEYRPISILREQLLNSILDEN